MLATAYDGVDKAIAAHSLPKGGVPIATAARVLLGADHEVVLAADDIRFGTATLDDGTVTVADTSITAKSLVLLMPVGITAAGHLGVTKVVGTSFTILSSSATDVRVVDYMIVERP